MNEQYERRPSAREAAGQCSVVAPSAALCGITDVGLVRANNEDGFLIALDGDLLAVADGLGGQPAGEVASQEALAVIAAYEARVGDFLTAGTVPTDARARALMLSMIQAAEQRLLEVADRQSWCRGMATTLVVTIVAPRCAWTCHVGDVRAYLSHHDWLRQITRDDSAVADLVDAGHLRAEQARTDPRRHVVTQALGLGLALEPSFHATPTVAGDVLLLCSDGLWEAVEPPELARIVASEGSAEARAIALVGEALRNGGLDNATAVLRQIREA